MQSKAHLTQQQNVSVTIQKELRQCAFVEVSPRQSILQMSSGFGKNF